MSLVLLFRAEIEQALCDTDSNCVAIGELKKLMHVALPKRLPLDEMHVVVASILDPSQRSLRTVKDYLVERGITTVDIDKIRSQVCGPGAGRGGGGARKKQKMGGGCRRKTLTPTPPCMVLQNPPPNPFRFKPHATGLAHQLDKMQLR